MVNSSPMFTDFSSSVRHQLFADCLLFIAEVMSGLFTAFFKKLNQQFATDEKDFMRTVTMTFNIEVTKQAAEQ